MEGKEYEPGMVKDGVVVDEGRIVALEEACADYAQVVDTNFVGPSAEEVHAAIEGMLERLDELSVMLGAVENDTAQTRALLPDLRAHFANVEATYAQIDALVEVVAALDGSVSAMEAAVADTEKQFASKITRKLSSLSSLFSRKKSAASKAPPAPTSNPAEAIVAVDTFFPPSPVGEEDLGTDDPPQAVQADQ